MPGTSIHDTVDTGGRYQVIRLLGRGGMGTVYLARQTALDRDVALKVIAVQEGALAQDAVARFEQEMRATARVEHPNTVRLYDSGPAGRGLYLAMEYLPGRTLREVLDADGRLPPARAVRIAKQIAHALAAAHRQRIVHRDLKPENIMLMDQFGEPDFVKVLDFGIARFLDVQTARLTATGAVIGTPVYMSPEQAQGRAVDEMTDLYALGVILYEMVCGRPPLVRESAISTLMAHVNEQPVPLPALAPDTPAALASLVMALLQKLPAARPASAEVVATALAELSGEPAAPPAPGRTPTVRLTGEEAAASGTAMLSQPGGTQALPESVRVQSPRQQAGRRGRTFLVATILVLVAGGGAVAVRLVRGQQARAADHRLNEIARARHEPRPRGCPACSPADLRALLSAAESESTPATALARLEAVAPVCVERWTAAARLRMAEGDVTGARADAARAVDICTTDALAHHLLGNASMKAGAADQAVAEWKQAAALEPGFAAPRFNLALNALAHRDPAAAIQLLDDAIAQDPTAPNAHHLRGRARLAAGDAAGAAADLAEAVRLAPRDAEAWKWLGLALKGRDQAAAQQAFCRARDLGSTDPAVQCPR
ncbi:MAG TPA: protein kinase [Polyangia bacterium]|nr:protein kinase [Polyangia bacterium]